MYSVSTHLGRAVNDRGKRSGNCVKLVLQGGEDGFVEVCLSAGGDC